MANSAGIRRRPTHHIIWRLQEPGFPKIFHEILTLKFLKTRNGVIKLTVQGFSRELPPNHVRLLADSHRARKPQQGPCRLTNDSEPKVYATFQYKLTAPPFRSTNNAHFPAYLVPETR